MQAKKTQIIRLGNVLGIDIDKEQHKIALLDAISGVSNPDDFIEYCRDKKDSIDYANRLDKLETLFTRYKNTIDDIPTEALQKFCKNLSDKIKVAISVLRDKEECLSVDLKRLQVDGNQYFTNKEINLLNEVGGLNRIMQLYELNTLYDTLYSSSVKKTLTARQHEALTDNQQRVKRIVGGAG